MKGKIPLKLPGLQIANKTIEGTFSLKFLGVMLDESITLKDHMHTIEKNSRKEHSKKSRTVTKWRIS